MLISWMRKMYAMPAVMITEYHTQVKDRAELGGQRAGQQASRFCQKARHRPHV